VLVTAAVPGHLTPAVAPFLKAHGVPGFSAGGVAGLDGLPGKLASALGADQGAALRADVTAALRADIRTAVAADRAARAAGLSGAMGDSGARTRSAAVAQAYARSLLSQYGWAASQMSSLIPLWNQESGWNAYAVNASSGAYGIPQSLGHGHPYALGDYKNQIIWGLNYIRGRYGSPAAAEAHELAFNWYDRGGYLPQGLSLAYNGTGRPEPVGGGGGNTYNITVHVPPTANQAEIGRHLVTAIGAFEKGSGKGWRK
jgi:hypothetical protein